MTNSISVVSFSPFIVSWSAPWTAAAKLGTWQQLATRAGGEVISSDWSGPTPVEEPVGRVEPDSGWVLAGDELDDLGNKFGGHNHDGVPGSAHRRFVLGNLLTFGLIVVVLGEFANALVPSPREFWQFQRGSGTNEEAGQVQYC